MLVAVVSDHRWRGVQAADQCDELRYYGSDAAALGELISTTPELGRQLHPALPILAAQIVWAVRHEMARTVDDVLARRTRALFLNAKAAIAMATDVAKLMALELDRDQRWQDAQRAEFTAIANNYVLRR